MPTHMIGHRHKKTCLCCMRTAKAHPRSLISALVILYLEIIVVKPALCSKFNILASLVCWFGLTLTNHLTLNSEFHSSKIIFITGCNQTRSLCQEGLIFKFTLKALGNDFKRRLIYTSESRVLMRCDLHVGEGLFQCEEARGKLIYQGITVCLAPAILVNKVV